MAETARVPVFIVLLVAVFLAELAGACAFVAWLAATLLA